MSRTAFIATGFDEKRGVAWLQGAAAHHLVRVLRRRVGERIELRDGRGSAWEGIIAAVEAEKVAVRLERRLDIATESPLEIWLALAYARNERMDLVVRQAVELGVGRFWAFAARRSRYRLDGTRQKRRLARWRKIAEEALCQCGRLQMPSIELFSGLDELLARLNEETARLSFLKILAYEKEREQGLMDLHKAFPEAKRVILVNGPEGGWEKGEVELLSRSGFAPIGLGPRIMRLETAAVALVTLAQGLWGDLC